MVRKLGVPARRFKEQWTVTSAGRTRILGRHGDHSGLHQRTVTPLDPAP